MFSLLEIINGHDKFFYNEIDKIFGFEHANDRYLDTKDPGVYKNTYVWSWQLLERQNVRFTSEGGRYFDKPRPAG
jgi:hypothetical protein